MQKLRYVLPLEGEFSTTLEKGHQRSIEKNMVGWMPGYLKNCKKFKSRKIP